MHGSESLHVHDMRRKLCLCSAVWFLLVSGIAAAAKTALSKTALLTCPPVCLGGRSRVSAGRRARLGQRTRARPGLRAGRQRVSAAVGPDRAAVCGEGARVQPHCGSGQCTTVPLLTASVPACPCPGSSPCSMSSVQDQCIVMLGCALAGVLV